MKTIELAAVLGVSLGVAAQEAVSQKTTPPMDYHVYVTAESADEVYHVVFDGQQTTTVKKVIEVGYQATEIEGPHGLTVDPNGKHWYLTMAHGKPFGILYKYTTNNDKLVGQTELGLFPATMQISKATGLLYCVNFDLHGNMQPSSVSIVDPDSMVEVARPVTGPMPHGSRLSPDGKTHYSCAMMSGELFAIDAMTFAVRRKMGLAEKPKPLPRLKGSTTSRPTPKIINPKPTWVHPHPTLPVVYVCLNGIREVAEVDIRKWKVVRRFPTGKGPYNCEVTPDGAKLLVSYKGDQAAGIIDTKTGVELARIKTGRRVTHGVVISPDGRFGFVSSEGIGSEKGTMDVIDMRSHKLVSSVELGLQAGGIAFWKAAPRAQ